MKIKSGVDFRHWLFGIIIIAFADTALAQANYAETLTRLCGNQENGIKIERALSGKAASLAIDATDSQKLRNLAIELREKALYDEALQTAYAALKVDLEAGRQADQLVGHDLAEIGLIHRWRSDSEAQSALLCTLNIRRQLPAGNNHPLTAAAQVELANFEMSFNRWRDADHYLTQAIGLLRGATTAWSGHLAAALVTQANLRASYPTDLPLDGRVLAMRGLYKEALEITRQLPECKVACMQVAISMDSLARSLNQGSGSVRSASAAAKYAADALVMKLTLKGAAHDSTATTYQTLAQIAAADGSQLLALKWYRLASWTLQVLAATSTGGRPAILSRLAEVSAEFAMYSQSTGTPDATAEAILQYMVSVDARQKMRAGAEGLPEDYRHDLTRSIADPYYQLATLLLDAGRISESEAVIDMLKEDELANFLRGGGGSTTRATFNQPVVLRSVEFARQLIDLNMERMKLEQIEPSTLTTVQSARLAELRVSAQKQIDQYERFIASLHMSPNDQQTTVDAVSRLQMRIRKDPNGAAGLRYVLAGHRVGIIVVLPGQEISTFSNVPEAKVMRLIKDLRESIQSLTDTRAPSQELWDALIEPILPVLQQAGVKTLVLSLTGALRYAPFAAFIDSKGKYLIEQFALASWPGAADGEPPSQSSSWSIAAMGLTKTWGEWPELPTVEAELQAIVKSDSASTGIMSGKSWGSTEFSRERFEASLLGSANVVHIATHFDLKQGDEQLSRLVLGIPNQLLSLREMRILNFDRVRLLTFSACQTALGGGTNENGIEVEGLAAVALKRGAKSVVASLWKVPDASTAFLMRHFYAGLVATAPLDMAAALQAAQLQVMNRAKNVSSSTPMSSSESPSPLWAHPFYWAPFVLGGHWR